MIAALCYTSDNQTQTQLWKIINVSLQYIVSFTKNWDNLQRFYCFAGRISSPSSPGRRLKPSSSTSGVAWGERQRAEWWRLLPVCDGRRRRQQPNPCPRCSSAYKWDSDFTHWPSGAVSFLAEAPAGSQSMQLFFSQHSLGHFQHSSDGSEWRESHTKCSEIHLDHTIFVWKRKIPTEAQLIFAPHDCETFFLFFFVSECLMADPKNTTWHHSSDVMFELSTSM